MFWYFYGPNNYPNLRASLYAHKSEIMPEMANCCCIWAEDTQPPFSSFDRVQIHLRILVRDKLFSTLQPISHNRYVANLSRLYS